MAVNRYNCFVDVAYIFKQVLNSFSVEMWQAITGCIGNVHYVSTSLDNCFYHLREKAKIGPARVFGIEFNFQSFALCVLNSPHTLLQYFSAGAEEFVLDVYIARTDPGVNT